MKIPAKWNCCAKPKRGSKGAKQRKRKWHREWLLRRRAKLERQKIRRYNRNDEATLELKALGSNEHSKKSVYYASRHKVVIELPETLDFNEHYEETATHFAILRNAVRGRQTVKKLRFDNIRYISPSAALVLASEVDRWNHAVKGKLRADIGSWDLNIKRLLCQMGYFELLKIPRPEEDTLTKGPTTFLQFKRGVLDQKDGGRIAKELRINIEEIVGQQIQKQFLYEGLSEAITNVGQHAYRHGSGFILQNWWLSASYDADTSRLCVMFYDHGSGIPETLPYADFFDKMRGFFSGWSDSDKIKAAMEIGRSATGKSERGKGLQNLLEFARTHDEGQLTIYSLNGMYRRKYSTVNGSQTAEIEQKDHKISIGGTLVEWYVQLQGNEKN